MLVVILVIAALVPLIAAIGPRQLGMHPFRRGASGVARHPAIAVAVALALSGAALVGAVAVLGQESDAALVRHDASLGVVAQTLASTVSGRVTDGSGNGLRDVWLVASPVGGWQRYSAATDVGGRYTLGAVDQGTYTLHVSAADGRYADRTRPLVVTSAGPVRLDIRLQSVERRENSMFQDAVVIDSDTSVESTLEPGDVRLYRFEVPADGRSVVVETRGEIDVVARLVRVVPDAPDEQLASDDDGGADANARIALELAPGWYIVEVQGYSSDISGPYEISVTLG